MTTEDTTQAKARGGARRGLPSDHLAFEVATLIIELIDLQPDRPRRAPEDFLKDELVESIHTVGVIYPILVVRLAGGRYEMRSGERRLNTCKLLGHTHVPAIIVMSTDDDAYGLIDNLLHEKLSALDEALWLAQLKGKHGFTDKRLAAMLGRSRPGVTQLLGVADIPVSILDDVRALPEPPSRDSLIQLSQCRDPELQKEVLEKIKEGATQVELRKVRKAAAPDEEPSVDADVIEVRRAIARALNRWNDPSAIRAAWAPTKDETADIRRFISLLQGQIKKRKDETVDAISVSDKEASASLH